MTRALELTGQVFGELTVVGPDSVRTGPRYWQCRCSCGKTTLVQGSKLVSGHTKSCGHLQSRGVPPTHGDTESREYRIWTDIKQRCNNPNRAAYYRYGGRGIKICDRWRDDYAAFLADMGRAPGAKSQIDRINNDGDYCPENCRWVSQAENKRNKSNTRYVEYQGRRMRLAEWAEELGVPVRVLSLRYWRGWTSEEIITGKKSTPPPPRKTARWIEHDGQRKTLTEWAREIGVPMKALHQQLSRGWSISDAIGAARKKGELDEQKHAA